MHPSIQLGNEVRAVLRQRSRIATADFYALIGQEAPGAKPRFIVRPAGRAFFHIVDSSTGKVRGFRREHNAACVHAQKLEQSQE